MTSKHFKLTTKTKVNLWGVTLFQIELTADCRWGKSGEAGGWIEKLENLSGNAFVSGNAEVFGNAKVSGNAEVSGDAKVSGDAEVFGNAFVSGNAEVFGNAEVSGNAEVFGDAEVFGNAEVSGNAFVSGDQWSKSPLQIQGTKHFVNVCKKNHLKIGCKIFTFEYWKEHFTSIGQDNGYTEQEITEYSLYIELAIKLG